MNIPEGILSDSAEPSETTDLFTRAFLETLRAVQAIVDDCDGGVETKSINELEGYTKQLLYDFLRVLCLANKWTLEKSGLGKLQMKYVDDRSQLTLVPLVKWCLISVLLLMLC